jgi:hypothetical protein
VGQIASWIRGNPFLTGIHWASGVELGMRLVAFTWTRRLLADWKDVATHFENNESFAQVVVAHQWLLANHHSFGSSANNHLIYEMAGLYISTSCMPWSTQSVMWRRQAAQILAAEFPRQIFPEGYTRELASDYNGFVLEALVICLVESALGSEPLDPKLEDCAQRMLGWLAANSDCKEHPPRQGDSDEASGLLLDAPDYDRWHDLSYLHHAWFRETPRSAPSLRGWLLAPLAHIENARETATAANTHESGLVVLRARPGTPAEIWCAFDAGPLGYLSIAAHGHADALALELRYGGVPVLVDPGTYAYAGPWRDWFRSTAAHNTIELGGASQSVSGGPFLWVRHAGATLCEAEGLDEAESRAQVVGEHDGYAPRQHRRSLILDRQNATLTVLDKLGASRPTELRMFWHLHPDIGCRLAGSAAELLCGGAVLRMALPRALAWRTVREPLSPGPGWHSPSFDVKRSAIALVGEGSLSGTLTLATAILFPAA